MLEEILENEIRKKSTEIIANMPNEFKYQIESICENWARTQVISYFQLMLDYCKERAKTLQKELDEEKKTSY